MLQSFHSESPRTEPQKPIPKSFQEYDLPNHAKLNIEKSFFICYNIFYTFILKQPAGLRRLSKCKIVKIKRERSLVYSIRLRLGYFQRHTHWRRYRQCCYDCRKKHLCCTGAFPLQPIQMSLSSAEDNEHDKK